MKYILIIILLALSACSMPSVIGQPSRPNLKQEIKQAETIAAQLDSLPVVQSEAQALATDLEQEQQNIDTYSDFTSEAVEQNEKLKEENAKLKDKAAAQFKARMAWIGTVSVFGIGISVILIFFTRSRAATMVAFGFATTLGISIAVSMYMQQIALAVIAILFISVTIYMMRELKKDKASETLPESKESDNELEPKEVV